MIGTIVRHELLLGRRRNRLFILRCLYAAWLVLQLIVFYIQYLEAENTKYFARYTAVMPNGAYAPPVDYSQAPSVVGAAFAETFVPQQFLLLAIATPALVAGAITDEKRRGTLQYLMLTDVGTRPLLLGKLLGRVAQVATLALVGLPLFALLGGFGGVKPLTFLAFLTLSALTVFAVAAAALLSSVLCRQTRDAVLALYGVGVVAGLVVWKVGGVLDVFKPFWVLDSADTIDPAELGSRLGQAALAWGTMAAACLGLAMWRLNPAYLRELEGSPSKKSFWHGGRRVPCDDDPVRWRERYVEGLSPVAGLRRIPQWLVVTLLALTTTTSSVLILTLALAPGNLPEAFSAVRQLDYARLDQLLPTAANGFLTQGVTIMLLASLVVGIRCSGAVTGERERQTWEALLLTPLNTREIIQGKLWGIMGASYAYLFACGLPALAFSLVAGPLAAFWMVLWLAVTVLAMYFIGAVGLWCSVRSKSSWQALLQTLLWGYGLGALVNAIFSLVLFVGLWVAVSGLVAIDIRLQTALARSLLTNLTKTVNLFRFAICVSLVLSSWLAARLILTWAQRRVSYKERTRHWHRPPIYRKAKRRPRRVATGSRS
jgi:ABC-type transport system involved in multi-copper enzyme maturation permease subunit